MSEQITVAQHYVPRFYMKNFAVVKKGKKNEKAFISFYQFSGDIYKNNIPTKSICYKNYFYGEDNVIEKQLMKKEEQWAKTIYGIVDNPERLLSDEQKKNLKEFAVYQYQRTEAMLKYGKESRSEMLVTHFMNNYRDLNKNDVKNIVEERVNKQIQASLYINICDELIEVIDDLAVSIIRFNTSHKLITSDMPVIVTNPFNISKAGMGSVGTVIMYPISSDIMIFIYDSKMYSLSSEYVVSTNEQDVVNINKYQVLSADDMVMAINEGVLVASVMQNDIILEREKNIEKKVLSSYDGQGTFFALKSRCINYKFDISLFRLPKEVQKIPIACRESFDRKYVSDVRFSILFRIYRLPNLLREDKRFSQADIRNKKEGYKKLLRFLDEYWKYQWKIEQ